MNPTGFAMASRYSGSEFHVEGPSCENACSPNTLPNDLTSIGVFKGAMEAMVPISSRIGYQALLKCKNLLAVGALQQTLVGELTALPQTP